MRALLVPIALFLLVAAPASAVRTAAEHSCLTSLSRPAGRTSRQDVKSRALLLSLRGGAAAETNKPANDEKKKSPFGLPATIGPTLYSHMDYVLLRNERYCSEVWASPNLNCSGSVFKGKDNSRIDLIELWELIMLKLYLLDWLLTHRQIRWIPDRAGLKIVAGSMKTWSIVCD